jgi:hypothetical protein
MKTSPITRFWITSGLLHAQNGLSILTVRSQIVGGFPKSSIRRDHFSDLLLKRPNSCGACSLQPFTA